MIYDRDAKYTFTKLAALNFKIAPGYAGIILFQNVIEGILPALLTLAISFFIDSFNADAGGGLFFGAFLVVVCIMVLQHMASAFFSFAHRGLRIALQRISDYEGVERVAALEYIYIEEREKYENTSRVTGGAANYIFSSYWIVLTTVSLVIRVVSLAVIFFRYNVWWVGGVIVLFSMPVFFLSYSCGEKVYKFYKSQYSHSLQMNHQTYILKSRETVHERTLFEYSDQIGQKWERFRKDYFKKQLTLHLHAERELKISSISSCILLGLLIVPVITAYFHKAITIGLLMAMVGNLIDLNFCINQALSPLASKVSEVKGFLLDLNKFIKYTFEPEHFLSRWSSLADMYSLLLRSGFPRKQILFPMYMHLVASNGVQYFDTLPPAKDEVFVDAGSYNGDTIRDFLKWSEGVYKKIYAFEPNEEMIPVIEGYLASENIKNVVFTHKATWDKEEELHFVRDACASRVGEEGEDRIQAIDIDSVVGDDKVTFIKMDVEGSELQSLVGARNTIKSNKPRLAISVYHKPEDVVEIAEYILKLNPEYRLMLRQYNSNFWETVLYAY